jgi:hypothetical protein
MAKRKSEGSGTRGRRSTSGEPPSSPSELILYTTLDQQTRIEVRLEDETVWLSQRQLAELFQKSVPTINEHIANVFDEGELEREATIRKSRIVQTEGAREVTREVELYNLDVIISVGYRVKSHRGTQFRIWAAQRLREYLVKGFALDDERLKEMRPQSRSRTSTRLPIGSGSSTRRLVAPRPAGARCTPVHCPCRLCPTSENGSTRAPCTRIPQ